MKVKITKTAKKSLEKLDITIQKRILDFLSELEILDNPRIRQIIKRQFKRILAL